MKLSTADKETLLSALGIVQRIVNDSTPVSSPIAEEPSAPIKKIPRRIAKRARQSVKRKTDFDPESISSSSSSSVDWEEAVPIDDFSLGEYSSSYSEEHRTDLKPTTSKPQRRKRVARFDIGEDDEEDAGEDITGGGGGIQDSAALEMMHAMRKLQGRGGIEAFIRTVGGARIWQHIRDVIRVQSTTDCFETFKKLIIDANLPEKEEMDVAVYSFCCLCNLKRRCRFSINGCTVGGNCVSLYDAIRDLFEYLKTMDPATVDMGRVGKLQAKIQSGKK